MDDTAAAVTLARLCGLEVSPFRLHLLTLRGFHLPAYKGSVFRGGFGQIFREISCVTRAQSCAGCRNAAHCGYCAVFETPVLPGQSGVLTKYTNAPHPFLLLPPLDGRTYLPVGARLAVDVTLIGPARRWFPQFLFVFDELGRRGNYGGPYRIDQATSLADGQVLFDGAARKILADPPCVSWTKPAQTVHRIAVEFVTPLRMRTDGRYNSAPDFVAFVHALLGRLHLLTSLYAGQPSQRDWMRDLLARADHIRTESAEFHPFHWERTSGRQQRSISMDGVLGRFTAVGDLTPFLPALHAGELLHAGSGTSMGMGKHRFRLES
jgi:hypothetical protein